MTKEDILHHFQDINFYYNDCMMYDDLSRMLDELIAEIKGKWIPVSERLPEEEHEVYCQLSDGSNAVLYVQDNWGQMEWVDGMMGTGTYDVVAWRENPEPYKAESEEPDDT